MTASVLKHTRARTRAHALPAILFAVAANGVDPDGHCNDLGQVRALVLGFTLRNLFAEKPGQQPQRGLQNSQLGAANILNQLQLMLPKCPWASPPLTLIFF